MSEIITHPTYDQIHEGCICLASQVTESDELPDLIIGLVRGGMLPAKILSNLLNIPMVAVHYSSTAGAGDNKNHSNIIPELKGKSVLIVDDICDSGLTLQEVYNELVGRNHVCRSAVLYYKENMGGHIPTYTYNTIQEDDPWIIFPWECE